MLDATRMRWLPNNFRACRFFAQLRLPKTGIMHSGQFVLNATIHWAKIINPAMIITTMEIQVSSLFITINE
jgi:hypothetical protein